MKKVFSICSAVVLTFTFLTGCGKSDKPAEKKVLRMATEATFPPYEYFEGKKIVGIDPDIVREVVESLGYELVIEDMKFDSVILAVQTKKADIAASGITVTEERKKQINFTVPYVTAAQVIIVAVDSPIKGVADLKGKRIGVQQGTTGDTYVTTKICEPQRFDNAALAVAALRAKKLDAVVADVEPAKVHVAAHPNEVKILPEALTQEEYAFALNKDNPELLRDFNKKLVEMHKSGRLQQILDKYLKSNKK